MRARSDPPSAIDWRDRGMVNPVQVRGLAMPFVVLQLSALRCNTPRRSTPQRSLSRCNAAPLGAAQSDMLQHAAPPCSGSLNQLSYLLLGTP